MTCSKAADKKLQPQLAILESYGHQSCQPYFCFLFSQHSQKSWTARIDTGILEKLKINEKKRNIDLFYEQISTHSPTYSLLCPLLSIVCICYFHRHAPMFSLLELVQKSLNDKLLDWGSREIRTLRHIRWPATLADVHLMCTATLTFWEFLLISVEGLYSHLALILEILF